MIVNDKQYAATKKKLKMLEDSLSAPKKKGVADAIARAAVAQTKELVDELRAKIVEYENAVNIDPAKIPLNSFADLLNAPIRYRLASRMSTEVFARFVGVSVRQIFRYELEEYRNCSIPNLDKILGKLNIRLKGNIAAD